MGAFSGPLRLRRSSLSLRLHPTERVVAGDGLDTADTGRDATFRDDLEKADVAGPRDVRAAAELARSADVEHAHFVAVFFAKEHHRAGFLRRLDWHHARLRRHVLQDLAD